MALSAVIGHAQALEGREAAAQATHRALDQLGRNQACVGVIIASYHHPIQQVLSGAAALLGDIPLIGLSTTCEITAEGPTQRGVIVALLSGEGLNPKVEFFAGFGDDSRGAAQHIAQALQLYQAQGTLLLVADGFNGDAKQLCAALPGGNYAVAGCLAGGNLHQARTYQIGGRQASSSGLAAALLGNNVLIGIGQAHGWQPTGAYFQVTRSQGPWVRTLDNRPAAEAYANLFKYPQRDWLHPPLNELVRLYPLGIEQKDRTLLVRSPLRMEADGSLRMHTSIPEGTTVHLMVGSSEACLEAARQAARQALQAIGEARPLLALLFTDIAWQMLFEAQLGREVQAVREILGPEIPLASGYTFGQISSLPGREKSRSAPELFNQAMQVILFAEPKA